MKKKYSLDHLMERNCFILQYLNKINQKTVMWNIEPESYEESSKSPETIANHVKENVKNGSIILLHPMNHSTGKF